MSTKYDPLRETLESDLAEAKHKLADLDEQRKLIQWKLDYATKLLDALKSLTDTSPLKTRIAGLTIGEVAAHVLEAERKPMSAMQIAQRAMEYGFTAENIERARSHFSAVISKDAKGEDPTFAYFSRGSIGLKAWLSDWQEEQPEDGPEPSSELPYRKEAQ